MRNIFVYILCIVFIAGCSTKPEPNEWKYKSAHYFNLYKREFLYAQDLLANSDLQDALEYAKRGGDFARIADIYLGKCALNIATGKEDECSNYKQMDGIGTSQYSLQYYKMLQKDFQNIDLSLLKNDYRRFVIAMQKKDIDKANRAVARVKDPVSQLLCIALLGEQASVSVLKQNLSALKYNGYKRGIEHILYLLEQKATDADTQKRLQRERNFLN